MTGLIGRFLKVAGVAMIVGGLGVAVGLFPVPDAQFVAVTALTGCGLASVAAGED